jgi:hypothetical protein
MAIDASLLNDCHGSKILFFTCGVGEPGIAARHLNAAVTQELLQALKAHTGIQELTGKGMTQTMERVALMRQSCFLYVRGKHRPGSFIAQGVSSPAIKQIAPLRVS